MVRLGRQARAEEQGRVVVFSHRTRHTAAPRRIIARQIFDSSAQHHDQVSRGGTHSPTQIAGRLQELAVHYSFNGLSHATASGNAFKHPEAMLQAPSQPENILSGSAARYKLSACSAPSFNSTAPYG
jgi:hypothetical protein